MEEKSPTVKPTYVIAMQPPPGNIVASNGFPADPRPAAAPKIFLDAMDIRIKVFCDEQKCPIEPELDEDDPRSWHWVLYGPKGGSNSLDQIEPLSVIRIVPPPHGPHPTGYEDPNEKPYVKLGRVATMEHARGKGLSKKITEQAFKWLAEHSQEVGHGWDGLVLAHAQVEVQGMYQKMGFLVDEKLGRWDEVGIEHCGLWKTIEIKSSC